MRKRLKIIGFDTETLLTKIDKHLSHQFYSAQFFNPELAINEYITEPEKVASLFNYKTQGAVFLANNAEFDFAVLSKILDLKEFKVNFLYNNARFMYAKLSKRKHCWHIWDLGNIFPNWSLEKIGKFVSCEKLKKPDNLGLQAPRTLEEKLYFRKYAMRDAEIGYVAGNWIYSHFNNLKMTLPSLALDFYQTKFKPYKIFMKTSSALEQKLRLSYKGGRCESYIRGTPDKKIYGYDIVSLYPSVMVENDYPCGDFGLWSKINMNLDNEGIALCTVQQEHEIPFLCSKVFTQDLSFKLVFPNGIFKGWFTYPELRYFLSAKIGKIIKVHEAYETKGTKPYFKNYINYFFKLKNEDKEHASFWKVTMNSLYGKFAQNSNSPEQTMTRINDKLQIEKVNKKKFEFQKNILISAYITSYARIKMHKLYVKVGKEDLVYTDTDSIHSFKPINEVGTNLGELDYKSEGFGTYIRSKFYILNDEVRCRGMERIFKANHVRSMIQNDNVQVMSQILLRLRNAYRQHKPFLTQHNQIKNFSLNEDYKRTYYKHLKGAELLTDYTHSGAVYENGIIK